LLKPEWTKLSDKIDEETQSGRKLPATGIIDVKAASHRCPTVEHGLKGAVIQVGTEDWLCAINYARSA
jgi:hypothetical protein